MSNPNLRNKDSNNNFIIINLKLLIFLKVFIITKLIKHLPCKFNVNKLIINFINVKLTKETLYHFLTLFSLKLKILENFLLYQ